MTLPDNATPNERKDFARLMKWLQPLIDDGYIIDHEVHEPPREHEGPRLWVSFRFNKDKPCPLGRLGRSPKMRYLSVRVLCSYNKP